MNSLEKKTRRATTLLCSVLKYSVKFLHSELMMSEKERFREFHNYTLMCGQPMAKILLSAIDHCRSCRKLLSLDVKLHPVVIYSLHRGRYLGCPLEKVCRKCKLHRHYGCCTQDGKKIYDHDVLKLQYIQSSEDIAFDIQLLEECNSLLIIAATPFSSYTSSYNRHFRYNKNTEQQNSTVKRMERYVICFTG